MSDIDYYHENFSFNPPNEKNFFEYVFSFKVDAPKEKIFQVIADTSTINKNLNVPPRYSSEINGELVIDTSFLGIDTQWIEKPWHWEFGRYIQVERFFNKGILSYESAVFRIIDNKPYEVQFYYRGYFKNKFFRFLYKIIFPAFGKKMAEVIQNLCSNETLAKVDKSNLSLHTQILNTLKETEISNELQEFLASIISSFDDDELYKLQVPELAERFNFDQDELLNAFLIASKIGLYEINWDVICPHCKGKRSRSHQLADILEEDECKPCKLKFKVDSLNKIDVNFTVNPKYREVREVSFCAAEPAKKPHILYNDLIKPKTQITINNELSKKHYRLRSIGIDGENIIDVSDPTNEKVEIFLSKTQLFKSAKNASINVFNNTDKELNIIFESLEEPKYALNPLRVFNNKIFKDLYKDQKLNAGVQLSLPDQIILFSDVVDSTKFYQSAGDKEAFKQIHQHFKIMKKVIDKHQGIIIKTIGDAVMATFKNVDAAINASKEIIEEIEKDSICHLKLRFSLHAGPVIAVNHNTGIDYFGNTVNLSAKLQAISNANELALSEDIHKLMLDSKSDIHFESRTYLGDKTGYVINLIDS